MDQIIRVAWDLNENTENRYQLVYEIAELAKKLYKSSQKLNITYFELDGDDHEINKEKIKECINFLKHIDNYTSKLIYNSVI